MIDAINDDANEMIESDELLDVLLKVDFKIIKSKGCFERQTEALGRLIIRTLLESVGPR
jgi:hypothetical protein